MSRSYRKTPICKDHTKGMKQIANRAVRNCKDVPDGGNYKKIFCSYDISDYSFRETYDEYRKSCLRRIAEYKLRGWRIDDSDYPNYNDWAKTYIRK